MIDIKSQLKFIVSGSEVKRYHTVRTLQEETVGHHSHMVAMLCCLMIEPTPSLLFAALTHDLAEHVTGDTPAPFKREMGISEQSAALEERILEDAGLFHEELSKEEKRVLKLADVFSGMIFCTREIQLGNSGMKTVLDRYKSYAEQMILSGFERQIFDAIGEMQ